MIYKEEILNFSEDEFESKIATVFKKALNDARVTGQSLESIIYEILEAIEERGKDEESLIKNLNTIKLILIEESKNSINNSYKKYITAKRICKESINREYALIEEFIDTIEDYAKTKNYQNILNSFLDKKEIIKDLEQKIRYNSYKNRKVYG